MSGWRVWWVDDGDSETFPDRDAAVADAVSRSDPGDTVTVHRKSCHNSRGGDDCPCRPEVIVVPPAARA